MAEHPIQGLMKTAMENLKEMVDVNTIVGEPVETPDGSVILPVSKVGFGFAAGGTEFEPFNEEKGGGREQREQSGFPFGGGSGGGVSITPVAFLVVNAEGVRSVSLEGTNHLYEKILEMAPQVLEKMQHVFSGKTKSSKGGENKTNIEKAIEDLSS
ncbi:GerW family sporulation protein [Bacillaceae bacterium]